MSAENGHRRIAEVNPDYRWAGQEARRVATNLREQAERLRGEAAALEAQALQLESILEQEVGEQETDTLSKAGKYVVYSANEAASNDAGFWSSEDGWVEDVEQATPFTEEESKMLNLPMSTGRDADWCPARNFMTAPSPR